MEKMHVLASYWATEGEKRRVMHGMMDGGVVEEGWEGGRGGSG